MKNPSVSKLNHLQVVIPGGLFINLEVCSMDPLE